MGGIKDSYRNPGAQLAVQPLRKKRELFLIKSGYLPLGCFLQGFDGHPDSPGGSFDLVRSRFRLAVASSLVVQGMSRQMQARGSSPYNCIDQRMTCPASWNSGFALKTARRGLVCL